MEQNLKRNMDRVANILLIEDDTLDVINVQRTLDKMSILNKTFIARNGEEAISFLKENNHENSECKPDIVLLDINMPKMNGLEFLQLVRKSEEWKNLKIFILTTSDEKVDKEAAKKLGVAGYITKPLKLNNPSSMDAFNFMIDMLNIKPRR
jgi:CheY-like chemotaxis protein